MKTLTYSRPDHEPEHVICTTGAHPIVYAPSALLAAATMGAFTYSLHQLLADQEIVARFASASGSILLAVTAFVSLKAFLTFHGTKIRVTNHGVTRTRKRFFWVRKKQTFFHSIEEVEVDQRGLGLLLNYGSLVLHLGDKSVTYRNLSDPQKVAEEIAAHLGHEHGQPHLTYC